MERQENKDRFADWEIGVATNVIERSRNRWEYLKLEFEDLRQECLTHWYFRKGKYDPTAGANQRTFMAKVVENKIGHIIEELKRDKRRFTVEAISLDQPLSDADDAPTLIDKIAADTDCISNLYIHAELKIEITRTIQKLTPKQQDLCRLLSEKGLSVKEASKLLKINRNTVYEEIKRIRAVFQNDNLHGYLE